MGKLSFNVNFVFKKPTSNVVQAKADGKIVFDDDKLKVRVGTTLYPITVESYSNKGKRIVYSRNRDKHGNYIKVIRDKELLSELPTANYIPFKPGLLAKGKLININNNTHFRIVAAYSGSSPDEYKNAIKAIEKLDEE